MREKFNVFQKQCLFLYLILALARFLFLDNRESSAVVVYWDNCIVLKCLFYSPRLQRVI